MEFIAETRRSRRARTDCAVVGLHEGGKLPPAATVLDRALGGRLARIVAQGDFAGRAGETLLLPDLGRGPAARVLLVGLGASRSWSRRAFRRALATAAQAVLRSGSRDALLLLGSEAVPELDAYYRARYVAEAFGAARYQIPDLKTARRPPAPRLARVRLECADRASQAAARRGLAHGAGIAAGTALTRDLANLPANVCTPTYLGGAAKRLAREHRAIRTRVLGEPELRRLGMGSFLSVTRGTDEPARLIVVEYRGGRTGAAPVALVGKGVTFDSGGISLKDPPGMDEMKFDMTGAAAVLGTIKALALIGAPVNVVGIVPACENMPSGRATKPGDIVRSMSGQTIEVLNTDAEGRLILCDALTYSRRFRPAAVIDIATLTGACVIALGQHLSAVMSNDDGLAAELLAAGKRAADGCWRMPLGEEYQEQLKSNFADFANVGGREGGAVTAACFLWKFVDGLKWAHLDIAGTAYLSGAQKGSTGRPVPLLVDYLLSPG
ncbi:MAG: leucyl aminopeptidase [Proteobacteria bacterium]|nr:leucyl aminopeptidase [Pseudomonadota bacterium]